MDKVIIKGAEYWQDKNGNKWDCSTCRHKEIAEICSKTLINCKNCTECMYCIDCHNCTNCTNCHYCISCINCHNCINNKEE